MNTVQKLKRHTRSSEQSFQLAAKIAKYVRPSFTIELVGDLGGGKTTFVKGLAKGLGITKTVTSPTFTIARSYDFAGGRLEHFDLYRLGQSDETVLAAIAEAVADPTAIIAIEWSSAAQSILPPDRLIIEFDFINETSRQLVFSATGPRSAAILRALS